MRTIVTSCAFIIAGAAWLSCTSVPTVPETTSGIAFNLYAMAGGAERIGYVAPSPDEGLLAQAEQGDESKKDDPPKKEDPPKKKCFAKRYKSTCLKSNKSGHCTEWKFECACVPSGCACVC
ncbi:MAG: hypothetical protein Q7S96_00865 [bacterium]|nr:hypothetical protein [bacterium]